MVVIYLGLLVILLAFLKYVVLGSLTCGSSDISGWLVKRVIMQAPACIAALL